MGGVADQSGQKRGGKGWGVYGGMNSLHLICLFCRWNGYFILATIVCCVVWRVLGVLILAKLANMLRYSTLHTKQGVPEKQDSRREEFSKVVPYYFVPKFLDIDPWKQSTSQLPYCCPIHIKPSSTVPPNQGAGNVETI